MKRFVFESLWICPFFGIIFICFAVFLQLSDFMAMPLIKFFYGLGAIMLSLFIIAKVYEERKKIS